MTNERRNAEKQTSGVGKRYLTTAQAAEYLNVSYMTVRRWIATGTVRAVRVGRVVRVDVASLDALATTANG